MVVPTVINRYREKAAETEYDGYVDAAEKSSEQGFSEGNLLRRSEDAAVEQPRGRASRRVSPGPAQPGCNRDRSTRWRDHMKETRAAALSSSRRPGVFIRHSHSGLIAENETRTLRARVEIRSVVSVQNVRWCQQRLSQ